MRDRVTVRVRGFRLLLTFMMSWSMFLSCSVWPLSFEAVSAPTCAAGGGGAWPRAHTRVRAAHAPAQPQAVLEAEAVEAEEEAEAEAEAEEGGGRTRRKDEEGGGRGRTGLFTGRQDEEMNLRFTYSCE